VHGVFPSNHKKRASSRVVQFSTGGAQNANQGGVEVEAIFQHFKLAGYVASSGCLVLSRSSRASNAENIKYLIEASVTIEGETFKTTFELLRMVEKRFKRSLLFRFQAMALRHEGVNHIEIKKSCEAVQPVRPRSTYIGEVRIWAETESRERVAQHCACKCCGSG
jgi:hypothetical protein